MAFGVIDSAVFSSVKPIVGPAHKALQQFELKTGLSDFLVHSNKAKLSNACKIFEEWLLQATADDR